MPFQSPGDNHLEMPSAPSLCKANFSVVRIPKGKNGYRLIYCPDPFAKEYLRQFIPGLEAVYQQQDQAKVNHGCVAGRSAITNAFEHIGRRFLLSLDLTDFFQSVNSKMLKGLVDDRILEDCLVDGAPQQGLPTSPLIANIAFLPIDKMIVDQLKRLSMDVTYTRYVDDLTFSFDIPGQEGKILSIVRPLIRNAGLKLNERKTKLQDSRNGRLIITGIGVDRWGLHPTRKSRRKLRAALHQGKISSARGLREWCLCKLPKGM